MLGTLLWQNIYANNLIAPSFIGVSSPLHSDGGPTTSPSLDGTASTFVWDQSGGTSLTPILHANTSTNDIVIVFATTLYRAGSGFSAPGGQGWSSASDVTNNPTAPILRTQVFWKRWGSGSTDDLTPTFSFSGAGDELKMIAAFTMKDCITTGNPFEDIESTTGEDLETLTAPSATSSGSGRTVLRLYLSELSIGLSGPSGSPTNIFSGASYAGGSEAGRAAVAGNYLTGFSAGSTGTQTIGGGGGASSTSIALTLILIPVTPTDSLTPTVHASTAHNDLIIASIWRVATPNTAITPPAGYTLLTSQQKTDGTDLRLDIYYHRYNSGTSDSTPTFTNNNPGSSPWSIALTTWRNVNTTTPFGSFGGITGTGATVTSPAAPVSDNGNKRTDVRFYATENDTNLNVLNGLLAAYSGSSWGSSVGGVSRAGACTYVEDLGVAPAPARSVGNGGANYAGITIILEPAEA